MPKAKTATKSATARPDQATNSAVSILAEDLLKFSEAAAEIPRPKGAPPLNPATIWRWVRRGISADNGERRFLAAVRIGSTMYTSRERLHEFVRANAVVTVDHVPPRAKRKGAK